MAQISDVMHASAVFDAARQELAWAYSGDFTDVPKPMKGAVHTISEVLNEAEMRWVMVVDKENAMAVVATGHEEKKKREDVGVVKEVDTRSIGEAERKIKRWLVRLEEVACDMRAVARKELLGDYSRIDDDKLSARWLPCLPRTRRAARIAPTIDTVALKLEELKEQYGEEFGDSTGLPLAATCAEQPACSSAAGGQEERETSVTGDVLVERDDDIKQRIIDIINDDIRIRSSCTISATILQIVGPPCVGKTALVKSVFHESSFVGAVSMVCVDMRKGRDIKEIHESIIEVLGRPHFAGRHNIDGKTYIRKVESEADYGRYIVQRLKFKKTRLLLVLDNLVEEQDSTMLEKLFKFLDDNADNVTAIVTTRSEAFAKYISFNRQQASSRAFQTGHGALEAPYRLHPLSDDMCWEIIKRTSGLDRLEATAAGNSEAAAVAVLERVGREIASKCSGIPLAAKALGRFLRSVDPQDVWNIGGGFSRDSQQLRRLPIHSATVFTHLKRSSGVLGEAWLSLAYCAFVFPKGKGHGVATCDLLNQWCSLGITTREGGASCISELLDSSLILGAGPASSSNYEETEAKRLLRMEDLMHDFARYHLGDRLVIVDGTNGATPSTSSPVNNKSSSAYLALVSNFDAKQLDISSILPAGILALRFEGCGEMELSDGAFASFGKYLRLLDLSGYSENKMLPDFIRHLKQLRYLKAPGIQDQVFPRSITGLHELRYLILQGSCQLQDLTNAFERLISNLLHLELSGCSRLKALPDSFGRLWKLEHLDLSACSGIEVLPESFGWLRNLRHLSGCSGLKALPESFGMLASLRHLDLSRCSELQDLPTSFQHLTQLRHLDLSGLSRLQALSMVSLPRELRHLNLSGCSGLQEKQLPDAPVPNELRHLDLSGCSSVRSLPSSYAKLEELVHLNLSGCSSLIKLPRVGGLDGGQWTRKLEHLDLSYCSQLTDMLYDSEVKNLQYLDLSGCFRIKNKYVSSLVETIRSRGRASGPQDASLRGLGTNGTTNVTP